MTTIDPPLGTPTAADAESTATSPEVQESASAPVVITEQQVLFGSAAAITAAGVYRGRVHGARDVPAVST